MASFCFYSTLLIYFGGVDVFEVKGKGQVVLYFL